jgi:hypothetical protein
MLLVALGFWLACAKKMPPPNPDRFAPSLEDVQAVNRNRVDLVFDEAMNRKNLSTANFSIVAPGGDSLPLLAVTVSADNLTVSLLTLPQAREKYALNGAAKDLAGNVTRFSRTFTGSTRPDTVAPVITSTSPSPNSVRVRKDIKVTLTFSKPMDTLSLGSFLVLPASLRNRFQHEWEPTLLMLRFAFMDSLGPDTTVSFLLPPGLRDFSGNRIDRTAYTCFTSDSVLMPEPVKGQIESDLRPLRNCYVVLEQGRPMLATLARSDGSFSLRAGREAYAVRVVADTNLDGRADLSAFQETGLLPDTVKLRLNPDPAQPRIDSLLNR